MTINWIAGCNSAYLFSYALGNFVSGYFEDRYPLRFLVSGGLLISSFLYAVIIFLGYMDIYEPPVFVVHWIGQGIAQSAVWPGVVAVMGNWFDKENRGTSMGFWSCNASVGDIIGAQLGGLILYLNGSWMVTVLPFALLQVLVASIFIFTVQDTPIDQFPNDDIVLRNLANSDGDTITLEVKRKKGIPFLKAIMLPGVIPYCINYSCVKFLLYGLNIWLPYFLDNQINKKSLTGTLASLLDVGGVIGTIVCGWIGDRMGYRSPIVVIFLVISLPFLLSFAYGTESIFWIYFIIIPITGFLIAGTSNIISSAIAADLAQNPEVENKDEAMATVTGIVDGCGGLGAAIGVFVMGVLSDISWLYVFLFMVSAGIVSIISIFHIAWKDYKSIRAGKKNKVSERSLYRD
jgi:sugar phosphate permease